ncbi:MAG: uncharacterized protein KVP18_003675 [Porospora cf. gigantea A]|uniref:uncharacterized protein n=1 Tax=Porospora cf. gigantea A TaxID=2853593 RepID=UPI00355AAD2C|nr:MAG: hypothetical protein KVP18_003675 [Porospora cf. gigantea A]
MPQLYLSTEKNHDPDDVEEMRRGGPVRVRIQPPDARVEFPKPLSTKQGLLAPAKRVADNLRQKAAAYPPAEPLSIHKLTAVTRAPPALPPEFYDLVGSTEAEGALSDMLTHQKSLPTCQHDPPRTILEYGSRTEEEARVGGWSSTDSYWRRECSSLP